MCVFAALISGRRSVEWLRWLGEHSLVIYVAFTIPMSLSRALALWSGAITQTGPLSAAVLIASIAIPVALYWIVKRSGVGGFLFERPAWARIAGDRDPARSERSAGDRAQAGAISQVARRAG